MLKEQILCLEDDITIQALVAASLKEYTVVAAKTIAEAETLIKRGTQFCALLIDIHLPDGDGLRFLAKITQNSENQSIPVLILSDHAGISNKVMAFTFGADDFIAKPFDPIELQARVTSKIKKKYAILEHSKIRRIGDLLLDADRQKVFWLTNGKETDLQLTAIELKILHLLSKRIEQVYSREQIMDQVWGQTFINDRTIDSHIAHLRQKISSSQVAIETVKAFGYRANLRSADTSPI